MTLTEKTLKLLAAQTDEEREEAIARLTPLQKDILIAGFAKVIAENGGRDVVLVLLFYLPKEQMFDFLLTDRLPQCYTLSCRKTMAESDRHLPYRF